MSGSVLIDYLPVLVFMGLALFMAVAAMALSLLLGRRNPYKDKNAPYECGFEPLSDARVRFDIRYYLVAILFIIFDIEVAFLFPWAVVLKEIGWAGFASMMVFLGVLTVGFVYEWKKGALEWE